jgi:hypothetical protein
MIIGYSVSKIKEVYISGSQKDMSNMAEIFSAGEGTIDCNVESSLPPYEQVAKKLVIKSVSKKLVNFSITNDNKILVEGESSMLLVISENIKGFLEYIDTESHIHIDYFDEHPYLDPASIPVIIGVS